MRRVNTFIGSPVERVEDLRFLRGRGQYVDDLVRPGTWHAAIVRSAVAHGRVRAIDTASALALPGVKAVFTASDLDKPIPTIPFRRPNPTIAPYAQPVIAEGVVRYVGEPLAIVIAEAPELAEDAAALVAVDIEHWPAVTERHASSSGIRQSTPTTSAPASPSSPSSSPVPTPKWILGTPLSASAAKIRLVCGRMACR